MGVKSVAPSLGFLLRMRLLSCLHLSSAHVVVQVLLHSPFPFGRTCIISLCLLLLRIAHSCLVVGVVLCTCFEHVLIVRIYLCACVSVCVLCVIPLDVFGCTLASLKRSTRIHVQT